MAIPTANDAPASLWAEGCTPPSNREAHTIMADYRHGYVKFQSGEYKVTWHPISKEVYVYWGTDKYADYLDRTFRRDFAFDGTASAKVVRNYAGQIAEALEPAPETG